MRPAPGILALVFVLALSSAQASHCTTWTTSVSSSEMMVIDYGEDTLLGRYFVNDLCQDDPHEENEPEDPNDPYGESDDTGPCLFSIWFYYETNGIPGLQRGDMVVDDSCHWMIASDTFLW